MGECVWGHFSSARTLLSWREMNSSFVLLLMEQRNATLQAKLCPGLQVWLRRREGEMDRMGEKRGGRRKMEGKPLTVASVKSSVTRGACNAMQGVL